MRFEVGDFYNDDINEIKRLIFRIILTNGFPVEIENQIYFTDENYNYLDSMFTNTQLITGATDTDGDGKVNPVENAPLDIEFTKDKVQNIENAKYLITRGRINTTNSENQESVKFYVDYLFDAKLGVIVDIETNASNY